MRYRDGHETPEGGRDAQRSGATEQSSGIATSGIGGETEVEGLDDSELLRSKHSRASKRRVERDEGPRQMAQGLRKVAN